MRTLEQAAPYAAWGNLPDEFGVRRRHVRGDGFDRSKTDAFVEALLSGGVGVLVNEIFVRRLPFAAVMQIAEPRVEDQKPSASRCFTGYAGLLLFGVKSENPTGDSVANFGGMGGNNHSEQQARGNEGFHGDSLFVNGVS
jgi:hypothetical protein